MTFYETISAFAEKSKAIKPHIDTESATSTSLVMPFFRLLGYDVDDPREFRPEYRAGFRLNDGNRVDFAIMREDKPIIIIEVKLCGTLLEPHIGQLRSYYTPAAAPFAVLTDGLTYRFFTDVKSSHVMDDASFLDIDLLSLDERSVAELERFSKERLSLADASSRAFELKYEKEIYARLSAEIENPSDTFVRLLSSDYDVDVARLKPIVKSAIELYVRDNAAEVDPQIDNGTGEAVSADPRPTEQVNSAFELVKSIVESTGSKHRYKLRLHETQKHFTFNYRNVTVCRFLKTSGGSIDAIAFLGTTVDVRKQVRRFDIGSIEGIAAFKPEILKQLEFIDWWYLNPDAKTGGIL